MKYLISLSLFLNIFFQSLNDGYSIEWAKTKAMVEAGIIAPDAEYLAIIED